MFLRHSVSARFRSVVRPRFAIISTGDELVDPAQQPGVGQVRDSNRYALAGALRELGAEPIHIPRATDDPGQTEAAIRRGLEVADGVLLTEARPLAFAIWFRALSIAWVNPASLCTVCACVPVNRQCSALLVPSR